MSKSESSRYATLSTWQPWQSLEIHIGSCLLTMAPDTISLADYIKDVLILLSMYIFITDCVDANEAKGEK